MFVVDDKLPFVNTKLSLFIYIMSIRSGYRFYIVNFLSKWYCNAKDYNKIVKKVIRNKIVKLGSECIYF